MKKTLIFLLCVILFSCSTNEDQNKKSPQKFKKTSDLRKKISKGVTSKNYNTFYNTNKSWFEQGELIDDVFYISEELYIKGSPYTGKFAFYINPDGKKITDIIYGIYFYGKDLPDLWSVHLHHGTMESVINTLERQYNRRYDKKTQPLIVKPFKY